MLVVPVQGVSRAQIVDSWGQSRANGARLHQATDIVAPEGTPVIAAAPGTVEKLFYSEGGGGITLYVRSSDRQWSYYYAHLQRYAPGMVEGMRVRAGDLLGFVGDTGNSGAGNFHLHFALSRMEPGDSWWKGQPVNPYPLLAGRSAAP
ncbi:MAG: M23 family metallopeptidase [Sphingomonas sp.]|uniref:M23 family metallopeptidase n=1 Tax=Sphingomonas sp. TaxID=28214 RepID=UPI0022745492|nr:M23 family metallopeptidase [Sphingomonas sp.]MCX8475829.1 M23 family metallopeptidase [Sphingomonas sp.]